MYVKSKLSDWQKTKSGGPSLIGKEPAEPVAKEWIDSTVRPWPRTALKQVPKAPSHARKIPGDVTNLASSRNHADSRDPSIGAMTTESRRAFDQKRKPPPKGSISGAYDSRIANAMLRKTAIDAAWEERRQQRTELSQRTFLGTQASDNASAPEDSTSSDDESGMAKPQTASANDVGNPEKYYKMLMGTVPVTNKEQNPPQAGDIDRSPQGEDVNQSTRRPDRTDSVPPNKWLSPAAGPRKAETRKKTAEADAKPTREENHWANYEEPWPDEVVRALRSSVWKPRGYDLNLDELEERVDYRQAWMVGMKGTKCILVAPAKETLGFVSLDGTDVDNFIRFHYPPLRTAPVVLSMTLDEIWNLSIEIPTGVVKFLSTTATIKLTSLVMNGTRSHGSRDRTSELLSHAFLKLVPQKFIDSLLVCIWEAKVQSTLVKYYV